MADFTTTKVNNNTVSATEWNQLADIDNAIISSGQTPATGDLGQLGKSMATYGGGGNFYTESGAANAYVLAPKGSLESPDAYFDGMIVKFRAGNASTAASTVNVNALGVKDIKNKDGSTAIAAGDIPTTSDSELRYDGTNFRLQNTDININALTEDTSPDTDADFLITYDASAGTNKKIKPESLFPNSQSTNGYTHLGNGLIIQWGRQVVSGNSYTTHSFNISFPNKCAVINTTYKSTSPGLVDVGAAEIVDNSTFGIANGADNSVTVMWTAIGN